ncbi:MAG: hypothetical protein DMG34_03300 [Acidobacteria bacterium]|nr:MAG: hypothetical protein DMG34_03300 [Acidobacteriota bacterium]
MIGRTAFSTGESSSTRRRRRPMPRIGQIEDQALFYLRTRGIDEVSARQILLLAFASECTERMKESAVRAFVQPLIESRVSQMAHMSREATSAARPQREGELQ